MWHVWKSDDLKDKKSSTIVKIKEVYDYYSLGLGTYFWYQQLGLS